jgi:hypothetical protein
MQVWQVCQNCLANVGESGESCNFPKKAILASASTRQKLIFFAEYSHSQNSPASSYCLVIPPFHPIYDIFDKFSISKQFLNKKAFLRTMDGKFKEI